MKLHWQILVAIGLGIKRNWHIFLALIGGIIVGLIFPFQYGDPAPLHNLLNFIGQAFIRLIQMIVVPLVISAIIVGIASLGDSKQLGKIGMKMVGYYALITVIAVTIGIALALTFTPGKGIKPKIDAQQSSLVQEKVEIIKQNTSNLSSLALNMIPGNPIGENNHSEKKMETTMVQILIAVIIFGAAFASIGEVNRPVVSFFESVFAATMKVTDWIMVLAMPGIFCLTAYSVAQAGLETIKELWLYASVILLGLALQFFVTYPLIIKIFSKVKFTSLYQAITEAMMVAFGTASSSATLPVTIACCERRAGISNKICSFVLPLGATMNMDATALFQSVAVIFIAQAYDISLTPLMIVLIGLLAIIASSASAGIPSAGLITMALILQGSLELSIEEVGQAYVLIFAVDRVLDMFRTMINVTSDTVVAAIIASNEGELDFELLENNEVWKEVV
ncbi:MAG TPA: dicarboxylate/amino acid:cation symporter [Candidatus Gastranaerophilales bacterium]|nr:dicarboxylate/amino acid:cation symporter [Candidatus Gastranaerophilales bacterium]